MTIADQLTTLNTTKQDIKTAIEAKGVTVGTVPFADYAALIASISGGGSAYNPATPVEWTQDLHTAVYNNSVAEAQAKAWVRPSDWLAMPAISASDYRFDGLVAVFNNQTNWVSITAAGDFTVDWGDGTAPENYAAGAQALHNYAWSSLSGTTETSEGFRQAIVTVTPQAGQTLYAWNLGQPIANVPTNYSAAWLDIQVAMNNSGTFDFGRADRHRPRRLKRFRWLGLNDQANFSNFFRNMTSLAVVELDTTGATTMDNMFNWCYALTTIPQFDTSTVTTTANMFHNCYSLITVPPLNLSSCTNISSMFWTCKNLRTVGQWTLLPGATGVLSTGNTFTSCDRLLITPDFGTAVFNTGVAMFSGCYDLVCLPAIRVNGTSYLSFFQNCYNLETILDIVPVTTLPTVLASTFLNCVKLDPPGFDCSAVTNANNAFENSNVSNISKFNFSNSITSATSMFNNTSIAGSVTFSTTIATTVENILSNNELITDLTFSFTGTSTGLAGNCFNLKKATVNINNASNSISLASAFSNCLNLESVTINLVNANSRLASTQSDVFSDCFNLREVIGLKFGTSTTTLTSSMFSNCTSLSRLRLDGLVASFTVANCALGPNALVELFESLGTASGRTATITGNWGAPLLTQSQRNIAIKKGFTLVG